MTALEMDKTEACSLSLWRRAGLSQFSIPLSALAYSGVCPSPGFSSAGSDSRWEYEDKSLQNLLLLCFAVFLHHEQGRDEGRDLA